MNTEHVMMRAMWQIAQIEPAEQYECIETVKQAFGCHQTDAVHVCALLYDSGWIEPVSNGTTYVTTTPDQ